jgi:hypothetical protein
MAPRNSYITRADFLAWIAAFTATSAADDPVIDDIIEQSSRICDDETGRHFYPLVQTQLYDYPKNPPTRDTDTLKLKDDLLSLTAFLNGDGTAVTSTDYNLLDVNFPPYWGIQIKDVSSISWQTNAAGSSQQVLSVSGIWGYHPTYSVDGWALATTLNGAITDTTGLTWNVTTGTALVVGQLVKIDNEFLIVSVVNVNAITFVKRGDDGSTAATHLTLAPIYIWNAYKPIKTAVYEIANSLYKARHGEGLGGGIARVTAAGVVLSPGDIPQRAKRILNDLMRYC